MNNYDNNKKILENAANAEVDLLKYYKNKLFDRNIEIPKNCDLTKLVDQNQDYSEIFVNEDLIVDLRFFNSKIIILNKSLQDHYLLYLKKLGLSDIHKKSFLPIKKNLDKEVISLIFYKEFFYVFLKTCFEVQHKSYRINSENEEFVFPEFPDFLNKTNVQIKFNDYLNYYISKYYADTMKNRKFLNFHEFEDFMRDTFLELFVLSLLYTFTCWLIYDPCLNFLNKEEINKIDFILNKYNRENWNTFNKNEIKKYTFFKEQSIDKLIEESINYVSSCFDIFKNKILA